MKYLSLFTGIGGFELGIQKAYGDLDYRYKADWTAEDVQEFLSDTTGELLERTATCVGYSEIDKYAIQIYQSHFPEHHNYGDITKINEEELPDFELLCGGFPCQSFSIAGKRGGFNDTRGTMFFHIARILAAKRPRLLLLENVKGLLSHDEGRTFATIISTLDELGYDIQWQVLNSKNHGVPQNRERVFIVGHLRGTRRPEVFPLEGTNGQDTDAGKDAEFRAQGVATRHLNRNGSLISEHASTLQVAETPHVLVGTLRTHKDGNGFREMQSGLAPTIPARAREDGSRQPVVMVPEATKLGYAVAEEGDSINLAVPNSTTRRGRVGKGIAQTLDTGMQQHTLVRETKDGFHQYRDDPKKSSVQGTHVTYPEGKSHALNTAHTPMTLEGLNIRRLTPTECERLQGFPDGWTEGVSDTQRYKTLGNAVTVNVIEAVISKMICD